MPTIDKRFLLKVLLAVLAFAGILAGGHTLQARRIPAALKRQAERAAEIEKPDAAIHYYRHYLEFEPDDAEVLEKLAELLLRRDTSYRGYTEYVFLGERILRIDPQRDAVRREVLSACLKMGRYSDAVTHAEALLDRFPTEAALWQRLGAAQTGLNQLAEARVSYETAIKHAPDSLVGYQRLAQLLWRNMEKPAEARAVLDRMVAALPQEPQAFYSRARFESYLADEPGPRSQTAKIDAALHDLHRVLELDPENADASVLLAEILQKGRNVPAAHAILRDAATLYPRDFRIIRSLAWLELSRGNVPASLAVLEEGLKYAPDGFDLLVPLTDLLVQQGDSTRSNEILERLQSRKAPAAQIKYLKARMAMRDRRWPDAIAQLDVLRTESLKQPGLETQLNLLLAVCYEKTANPDAEEKAFKRILSADPTNVPARVGLATLCLNLGRFDDAIHELDTAVQSPYAPETAHSQLVRLKAHRMALSGASADEWRRLEQAAYTAAAKFGPVSSDALVLRAEVAAAQFKYGEAIKLLRQETTRRPGDTRLWAALARLTADALGSAAGLMVMDEAQAASGDGPEIRLARAALYAREPGRFRSIDRLAENIDAWAEADQLRLLYGLVEIYDQMIEVNDPAGANEKVINLLTRIAKHRPADVSLLFRLHARAVMESKSKPRMNNWELHQRYFGAISSDIHMALEKIEGKKGPTVLLCEAALHPDAERLHRVIEHFGDSPTNADACLAIARWKAESGDTPESLRLCRRAFLLEPTRYETARALLVALWTHGSQDEAKKFLTQLAIDSRWASGQFRRLVSGALELMPRETAQAAVAWCQPYLLREPGGLGWLANCYAAVGMPKKADAALTAATKMPTATADDWLRLAIHQARDGNKTATRETLQAAREKLPARVFFPLAAAFLETPEGTNWLPDTPRAADKRMFAQARLAVKLSRSARTEAAAVLESYLAEVDLPKADAGWARRNLAMIYAIGGNAEDRARALALLKEASDDGASADELRATASVLSTLARYLESEDRKAVLARAAAALEQVYQRSDSPRDLFNLSQLYRAAGNRKASRQNFMKLLKSDPQNLYYLTAALEELTEDRNFQGGEAFADALRAKYAGEFRAVATVARYEAKAGRPERALALAEGYASAAEAGAGDYLARAARVAELLDELARYANVRGTPVGKKIAAAAVERYAALAPTRPEAVVGIAGLLGAETSIAEAFAEIDRHAKHLSVRVRALAGLAAVRSGGATERQFDQVKAWIEAAAKEDRESIPLQLSAAELHALRQAYPAAAAVYEAILKREPHNAIALNNLAWILAADPNQAQRALDLLDRAAREVGLTGELLDTRARARITLKQLPQANRDLTDSMMQEATGLRWFHCAVLQLAQSPPNRAEALKAFREARDRGLDPRSVHPADLATYRTLDDDERKPK